MGSKMHPMNHASNMKSVVPDAGIKHEQVTTSHDIMWHVIIHPYDSYIWQQCFHILITFTSVTQGNYEAYSTVKANSM